MKTELKEVLHLYLGAKFVLKIKGTEDLSQPMTISSDALHAAHSTGDYKIEPILILRKLDSITDEEKIKLFDAIFPTGLWGIVETGKTNTIDHILDIEADSWSDLGERVHQFMGLHAFNIMLNWLRKNSFDCDELIDSGAAIDSATLKNKEG